MNIILIEDSVRFAREAVETLQKIKKERHEDHQIFVLSCNGRSFFQQLFDQNKIDFPQVSWYFINDETELRQQLHQIIETNNDCVIATDLTLFNKHSKYEDYESIKTIQQVIKKCKLDINRITIYSQEQGIDEVQKLFNVPIKTHVRGPFFDTDEANYFYNLIFKNLSQ